ncbi:MAG TPA: dienelactone hydrolase family protein [Pseudomonas sp.]|jgi:phospholipase/carboxylesterase
MLKFFAALLFVCSGLVQAQDALQTDLPLSYLAQASIDSQDKPLIVFMHGYGSNEKDLFGIKDLLSADYNYLSVRAPVQLRPGSFQWFTQKPQSPDYDGVTVDLKSSGERLALFIKAAAEKYHTQPGKVFLVGFSQGAIMSYEIALRHPGSVGGIAALSGRVLPVLRADLKAQGKPDSQLKNLAVFIGHGTADPRLPFSGAKDAEAYVKSLGITPEFHGYSGVGHTISEAEVDDLKAWLEKVAR